MEYSVVGQEGETLFEAMQKAGIPVESPCGGNGTCGKCAVMVSSADLDFPSSGTVLPPAGESAVLSGTVLGSVLGSTLLSEDSGYESRLSCRTRFRQNGSASVVTAERTLRIVDGFELPMPSGEPALERKNFVLPDPELRQAGSELARLEAATGSRFDDSLEAATALGKQVKDGKRTVIALIQHSIDGIIHADIDEDLPETLIAAAVDIGTTTVAVRILDAVTASVLATGAEANVQRWAGADVISRIGASAKAEAFVRMSEGIRAQIERMILALAQSAGYEARAVRRVAIAGNPTMLHLLAGVDPEGIARAPFVPVFTSAFDLPAPQAPAGRPFHRSCRVILIPGISAYVGADLVAGALACGLGTGSGAEEPVLLLDLGTNGEIMLFAKGQCWCCSAAAGPAFEGASIEFGCPSIPGAIDHVRVSGGKIGISVIGDGAATGICGSGILDSVACLLAAEAIDETGRIDPDASTLEPGCFTVFKNKPAVVLDRVSGILLTQDDIRQVQLAKAAVAAGVEILMKEAEITPAQMNKVYLAGGFGSRLDSRSALAIGLLHRDFAGRIEAVGNSALAGAQIVALRAGALDACSELARRCRAIELSGRPDFVEHFSEAMFFPETTG